jgi:hypothetical protein
MVSLPHFIAALLCMGVLAAALFSEPFNPSTKRRPQNTLVGGWEIAK